MANRNWGEIPADVVQEIGRFLFDDDREVVSRVCSGWRRAMKVKNTMIKRHCQPPLLMLAEPPGTPYHRFYSRVTGKVRKTDIPLYDEERIHDRYFSSRGWIISVSQIADRITLFNPFLAAVIEAPPVPDELIPHCKDDGWGEEPWRKSLLCFERFILPSHHLTTNDFVAVIFEVHNQVGFWRIGHDRWVKPITGPGQTAIFDPGYCHDVCFHNGGFYAINEGSELIAFATDDQINWYPKKIIGLSEKGLNRRANGLPEFYIVGGWEQDSILVVLRLAIFRKNDNYYTRRVTVFELNLETEEVVRVTSLGNRSVFIGFNSSFFVEVPPSQGGYKPNCIYFTDDNDDWYDDWPYGGGKDMGIYSLDENKVLDDRVYQGAPESSYSFISPPMWVENS